MLEGDGCCDADHAGDALASDADKLHVQIQFQILVTNPPIHLLQWLPLTRSISRT